MTSGTSHTEQSNSVRDIIVSGDGASITISQENVTINAEEFREVISSSIKRLKSELNNSATSDENHSILKLQLNDYENKLAELEEDFSGQKHELQKALGLIDALQNDFGLNELELAKEHDQRDNTVLAQAFLQSSLAKRANHLARSYILLSKLLQKNNDHKGTLQYTQLAVNICPENGYYWLLHAKAFLLNGNIIMAEESYDRVMELEPVSYDLLAHGLVGHNDYWRLEFFHFLIEWRKDKNKAHALLKVYDEFDGELPKSLVEALNELKQNTEKFSTEDMQTCNVYELNGKGQELAADNMHNEAISLYQRAIDILSDDERGGIVDGQLLINLSSSQLALMEFDKCEDSWRQAKSILGIDHPFVINSLNNFARLASNLGNYRIAQKWGAMTVELVDDTYGVGSTESVGVRQNLLQITSDAKNYTEALLLAEEIYEMGKQRKIPHWTPDDYKQLETSIKNLKELSGQTASESHKQSWWSKLLRKQ